MSKVKSYKKTKIGEHELRPETLMMSYGYAPEWSENAVKPPVYLTSTFVFKDARDGEDFFNVMSGRKKAELGSEHEGLIYGRFNHPNAEIIEDRLALLEGAERAIVTSSGMGAISAAFFAFLRPGDVMVHSAPLYGGTETLIRKLLGEFNIGHEGFYDGLGPAEFEGALEKAAQKAEGQGRVGMVFVETPANPTNAIVDFQMLNTALDKFEAKHGYRPVTVCDNTMMGPVFQQAVPQGIDLAIYSLTKYVGGHSDLTAGAVCGNDEHIRKVRGIRGAMGFNLDPHTSWMVSRSLETLTIRMQRAAETGRKVAQWIADNPYVSAKVYHPDLIEDAVYKAAYSRQASGPGSTFAFVLEEPKEVMFELIDALSIFKSAVSLGGSESLVCHPASTTHSGVDAQSRAKSGTVDGLVRLSIGLEHPEDLIADLDHAFTSVFG